MATHSFNTLCYIVFVCILVAVQSTQYVVEVKDYPDSIALPPLTGVFSTPPPPSFPFNFAGVPKTVISIHQSGSFHFWPTDPCCNRNSASSCRDQCTLATSPQKTHSALFPLFQPSGDPATGYKVTQRYFSNETMYILRSVARNDNIEKTVTTILLPPSTIIIHYEASTGTPAFSASAYFFSGLLLPAGVMGTRSPRIDEDPSIFTSTAGTLAIQPTSVVAPSASLLAPGKYSLFCAIGNSICAHPLTVLPGDFISVTTNGDNSCYRKDKRYTLSQLAATPPPLQCIFTGAANSATAAVYDEVSNTFKCAAPAAVGAYSLSLAGPSISATLALQTLQFASDGTTTATVTVAADAAPTGNTMTPGGGSAGSTTHYECGCAENRWALTVGGRGVRGRWGYNASSVAWGSVYTNADTYSTDYCYRDCNGDYGGDAEVDDCGECVGGLTGRTWGESMDCSGRCGGPDTSCRTDTTTLSALDGGSVAAAVDWTRTVRTLIHVLSSPLSVMSPLATEDVRTDKAYIYSAMDSMDIYKLVATVFVLLVLLVAFFVLFDDCKKRRQGVPVRRIQPPPSAPRALAANANAWGERDIDVDQRALRNLDLATGRRDPRAEARGEFPTGSQSSRRSGGDTSRSQRTRTLEQDARAARSPRSARDTGSLERQSSRRARGGVELHQLRQADLGLAAGGGSGSGGGNASSRTAPDEFYRGTGFRLDAYVGEDSVSRRDPASPASLPSHAASPQSRSGGSSARRAQERSSTGSPRVSSRAQTPVPVDSGSGRNSTVDLHSVGFTMADEGSPRTARARPTGTSSRGAPEGSTRRSTQSRGLVRPGASRQSSLNDNASP